jgi:hypothetical protein
LWALETRMPTVVPGPRADAAGWLLATIEIANLLDGLDGLGRGPDAWEAAHLVSAIGALNVDMPEEAVLFLRRVQMRPEGLPAEPTEVTVQGLRTTLMALVRERTLGGE